MAVPGFFAAAPVGVAFKGGFVHVSEQGLTLGPHTPENRCRFAYGFDLAETPSDAWTAFLSALFRDDADGAEKVACLGEFFGASVLGLATRYQKAIVAKGGGDQGKSTLAKIVLAAMPSGATCAIAPQDMGQEYRRAMLAGKRLNVVNELPEATIIASEAFKAIVTGDPIVGRQIREAPFTFSPEAGHYFAANRLPGTNDQTEGFWRRLIVIEFNRSFKDDPERDPLVAEKIIREHLPGVVRWMLEGAARLLQQGRYTLPSSHDAALAEWRLASDQIALFLHECGELDATAAIGATPLYERYRNWALSSGHKRRPRERRPPGEFVEAAALHAVIYLRVLGRCQRLLPRTARRHLALAWVGDVVHTGAVRGAWPGTEEHLTGYLDDGIAAGAVVARAREFWAEVMWALP